MRNKETFSSWYYTTIMRENVYDACIGKIDGRTVNTLYFMIME